MPHTHTQLYLKLNLVVDGTKSPSVHYLWAKVHLQLFSLHYVKLNKTLTACSVLKHIKDIFGKHKYSFLQTDVRVVKIFSSNPMELLF